MADIFLSYASVDLERVRPIVNRLEELGWTVWWDREIPPGQTWPQHIEQGLAVTKAMIVVWSVSSVNSEWVEIEATKGKQRGALIPVSIDPVDPPLQFSLIQSADLSAWDHSVEDQQFQKVIKELVRVLGKAAVVTKPVAERKTESTRHPVNNPEQSASVPPVAKSTVEARHGNPGKSISAEETAKTQKEGLDQEVTTPTDDERKETDPNRSEHVNRPHLSGSDGRFRGGSFFLLAIIGVLLSIAGATLVQGYIKEQDIWLLEPTFWAPMVAAVMLGIVLVKNRKSG